MASQRSQPNGSRSLPTSQLNESLPTSQPNGSLPSSQPNVSPATSSQSNASQDTESHQVEKLLVIITTDGKAVGPNQAKFQSQAGHYLKFKIPIHYTEWKEVKQNFKDEVWNKLTAEFKFNIPTTLARVHLEKGFPAKWRVIKSRIRTKYLKDAGSIEEAIGRCPDGFDRNNWVKFVTLESDPDVIARNQKNAENRKRNLSDFCGGRQSYAQKLYLMDEASPEKQHDRVDVWLKARERPDGTVPESIREKYQQVKLAHERIMSSTSNEDGMENYVDLDSDALAEVFGREKRTRTRGVCPFTSKKQLQFAAIGKSLLHNADSSTSMLEAQMEVMQSEIKNMSKAFMALMHQVGSNAASCVQPPPSTSTPQAEVGCSSTHRPSQPNPQNLMNLFDHVDPDRRSVVNPKVILLDRNRKEVAEGYVDTSETAGICHGRIVLPGEKKVLVQKVLDGNALIYDGPQNGNATLFDIAPEGFIVWLDARLKY